MVCHRRGTWREGKVRLERPRRSDDGITLHLKGVQGEWHAGVIGPVTHARCIGMVERVLMEVTVPFESPNAGHVGREVGWPLASLRSVSCDRIIAQDTQSCEAE